MLAATPKKYREGSAPPRETVRAPRIPDSLQKMAPRQWLELTELLS